MTQIEIEAAATDLHNLIERARSGEEVVLIEGGRQLVKLVPVAQGAAEDLPPRRLGIARGAWKIPDDFDAPLPDDLLDLFYKGPLFPDNPPPPSKKKP